MAPIPSSTSSKLLGEFVGTFLLIFTVGCNVLSKNALWGGVSIASVLMVAIYALGGVSGANFNPAVSLALGVTKKMNGPGLEIQDMFMYMGVQLAAGLSAAFCYTLLFFQTFNLEPAPGFGGMSAGLCEFFYTFILCFVVLNVAAAEKSGNCPNQFYGLAIGFVIVAGAYGAGAVSGGCFNPAVAVAIDSASIFKGFGWCIFYANCEFMGALVAAVAFKFCRPAEFGGEKTANSELLSEFLGTFVLILTVGLNVMAKSSAGAFSIAASLMCMIYALGNVSGAHFNPAVTVAICASRRCPDLTGEKAIKYILAQAAGATAAGLAYSAVYKGGAFPLGPGTGYIWTQVAVAEIIFTFVLCYVVLCVAVSGITNSPTMFGLAIGACVTVGGNAIGAISGGSLNPAVSLGIVVANGGNFVACLCYAFFELIGAGLAATVFATTHKVDLEIAAVKKAAEEAEA